MRVMIERVRINLLLELAEFVRWYFLIGDVRYVVEANEYRR
jgi:hypothetical protein